MAGTKNPVSEGKAVGYKRPPKNRQFGQPEGNKPVNRQYWKKEDTPRFKLEKMMAMTLAELRAVEKDSKASAFERRLATAVLGSEWAQIEKMINQVYGMPKQVVEQTNIEPPKGLLRKNDKGN